MASVITLISVVWLWGCSAEPTKAPSQGVMEGPERDAWQLPDSVLAWVGQTQGKTVVDLGAGTGYFSFLLLQGGARVVAAEPDSLLRSQLQSRALSQARSALADSSLRVEAVPYDSPGRYISQADLVLLVNVYPVLPDRPRYMQQLHRQLRPGARLVVVELKPSAQAAGLPLYERLSPQEVIEELRQAGFRSFELDTLKLPYQYLLHAQ